MGYRGQCSDFCSHDPFSVVATVFFFFFLIFLGVLSVNPLILIKYFFPLRLLKVIE